MKHLPASLVFHLDLLLYLLGTLRPKDACELNSRAVRAAFERFFERSPFRAYPRIVACTLLPEFELVQHNWLRRLANGMTLGNYLLATKHDLIVNIPSPRSFYEGVCHEWSEIVNRRAVWHGVRQWYPPGPEPQSQLNRQP